MTGSQRLRRRVFDESSGSGENLAMDELSAAQIEELEADLRALQTELAEELAASAEAARPVDLDQPFGRVSRIDAIQQQSMVKAGRRNIERRASQVAAARAAIDHGEYGLCRRCEEPVGYARLKARPETPFCLRCQGRSERA